MYNVLSLFANVGIAETYLPDIGIDVVLANELEPKRAKFYSEMHPKSEMICGDITDTDIKSEIITKARKKEVNIIMATPPCQGMSMAGKRNPFDERNTLICHVLDIIHQLNPKYVFIENVTQLLKTYIVINGEECLITDYLKSELSHNYHIEINTIDTANFGVAQTRKRVIILMSRKDQSKIWTLPASEKEVSMNDVIGHLPSLDPQITDVEEKLWIQTFPDYYIKKAAGESVSKFHTPPKMTYRHALALMHTPEDRSALRNQDKWRPKKENGEFVKGFGSTYKRQAWDKPAYTVTMSNGSITSQNNGHPGRPIGTDSDGFPIYSDARVLSLYELFLVSSLPANWMPPEWASENFIRNVIGEGIPPLFVKKVFKKLL